MNLYQPHLVRIEEIIDETGDTRTLRLKFENPSVAEQFDFKAGQFGEYSVFSAGECTFCIASSPTRKGYIEVSFKEVGKVTQAMRRLNVGDTMGFRGPYGNYFPLEEMFGKNIVFIAGGIGLAPVRCVIWNTLDLRDRFNNISIIYGARSVDDLVYKRELDEWARRSDIRLYQCVDPGGETSDWKGDVCFVPSLVEKVAPSPEDACAVVCGPPIVIRLGLPILEKMGFPQQQIYTTLENRMKCGLGKCGRCNVGSFYVCKDGPIITAEQLKFLPTEY
jgi:sulfhydrogenase subunit gamma (sulfur reductase)